MLETSKDILVEELKVAFSQLVEYYSGMTPELKTVELTGIEPSYSSSIGFGHEMFRGSVTLLTNAQDANQIGGDVTSSITDWLGELANQVVGRFKNKVSEYGPLMNMGLPVTLCGRDLSISGAEEAHWHIRWSNIYLTVVLKLEVSDELLLVKDESISSAEEGSLCLF